MIRVANHRELLLADDTDTYIGREVLATGGFEFDLVTKAVRLTGPRRVLVDVGANIGTVCVPAVSRGLAQRAIAIEPDPNNFRLLRCNTILNEVDQLVTCVQAAAGDTTRTVHLELADDGNQGDHRVGDGTGPRTSIEVPMQPLSPLLDASTDDLVWVDVQGCEPLVLDGWPELTERNVPMVIEVAPWLLGDSVNRLLDQLAGYDTFTDLRNSDQAVPVDQLPEFVANIPDGHHRDLLMR